MKTYRTILLAGAAMTFSIACSGSTAVAGWFSHGSSGGSHGSSGGSHGSSGGSWGSWGSHGSSGGSYGSSGGSNGSSGGSWGSWGSNGSSGGSYDWSGGTSGGYYVVAQTPRASVAPTNVAYLNLNVPADAVVYLQDQRMSLTGERRRFVSPAISDGLPHVYSIRVELNRDGRSISKTTTATVSAGQEVAVTVSYDAQTAKELVASVTPAASR